jgi:hypothetical protein
MNLVSRSADLAVPVKSNNLPFCAAPALRSFAGSPDNSITQVFPLSLPIDSVGICDHL